MPTNFFFILIPFNIVLVHFIRIQIQIGNGINEVGIVKHNNGKAKVDIGQKVIKIDPRYFRPSEVDFLLGDSTKANLILNWKPKYDLDSLIQEMVDHDLSLFKP